MWAFIRNNATLCNSATLAKMEEMARHPKVVGYGEIGLDFFRKPFSSRTFNGRSSWISCTLQKRFKNLS